MIKKYKVVFTAGSFDLLHFGHLNLLLKAKELGDTLIVAVSNDRLIKKHKGLKPIVPFEERIKLVKELKCVDKVVEQKGLISLKQFNYLKADIMVLGSDWKERYDNETLNYLRDNGKVIFIPYTKHLSSSKIKEKIIRNSYDIIKQQVKNRGNRG